MVTLSMILSDLWPGFEGLDKFFVVEYRKTGVSWRQVTIAQQVTMPNIANGTMFCAFHWPLNASRGFVSISWASCFLYCSISGNVGTNGLKEHCGVFTAIHYCTANDQLRVYSPFSGAAVLHLYGACIQIGTTGLKLDVNEWPFPFHQIDAVVHGRNELYIVPHSDMSTFQTYYIVTLQVGWSWACKGCDQSHLAAATSAR